MQGFAQIVIACLVHREWFAEMCHDVSVVGSFIICSCCVVLACVSQIAQFRDDVGLCGVR